MMNIKTNKKGFSLIEVMIALVVLAVGILGISKLQGTLIRNSSDANQRTVAVSVAQQKIDDLRSFVNLNVGTNSDAIPDTWVPGIADSLLAFDHIADDAGGTIEATAMSVGNYAYTLDWDVVDYYYTGSPSVATTPVPGGTRTDFKRITINVAWTDEQGDDQSISLNTVVDSYAPALTALSDNSSTGGTPPQAFYTPEEAPDVIDVGVGNGVNRQTSKPLPDALTTGSNNNVLVTFEVISYHQDGSDFIQDRQEDFLTLDCTCDLSVSNGVAYPPGHVRWNETDNDRSDFVDSPISKATATETDNANEADEFCTICCRDHHDDDASAIKYVAGTTSGDHAHYKANSTVAGAGDEYQESCRFKRIDGIMRVFQDWQLVDMTVMNRNNLVDGDALQTQYVAYVDQLIKDKIASPNTNLAVKPSLRTPINSAVGTSQQLESRGLYLDDVYDNTGSLSSAYTSYVNDTGNVDRLERVAFTEVNLTLLSQWTAEDAAVVSVRNDVIAGTADPVNDYYGTYVRGVITAHAAATPTGSDITSSMEPSNDGLTQLAINPSPTTSATDTVEIVVAATPTNITVTGDISLTSSDGSNINGVKPDMNTAECTFDDNSNGPFTCSFVSGSNVIISVTASKNNGCSGSASFSQNNVTSDISAGVLAIDCTI